MSYLNKKTDQMSTIRENLFLLANGIHRDQSKLLMLPTYVELPRA